MIDVTVDGDATKGWWKGVKVGGAQILQVRDPAAALKLITDATSNRA
jgi:hypothetical protein